MTVVSIGPPISGMVPSIRDITLSCMILSKKDGPSGSGAGSFTMAVEDYGTVFSSGETKSGIVTIRHQFRTVGGKLRLGMTINLSGATPTEPATTAYFFADQMFEFKFNLPGGTNGSSYLVYQGGAKVDSVIVSPDDVYLYTFRSSSDENVFVHRYAQDKVSFDGFTWVKAGQMENTPAGSSSGSAPGSGTPPVDVPSANGGAGTNGATSGTGNDWTAPADGEETRGDKALTADVYREGVDGIVKAIKASRGGGGGGGGDEGVPGADGLGTGADGAGGVGSKVADAKTTGSSAATPAVSGRSFGVPSVSIGSNSSVTAMIAGESVELNPSLSDKVDGPFRALAALVHALVGWGAILGLSTYAYREIRGAIGIVLITGKQGTFAVERVLTSSAISSLGAIAARVAMIAALSTAFLLMPAAFVQLYSDDWHSLAMTAANQFTSNSGGGASKVVSIANDFVPVATLITVGVTYSILELALLPLQIVWQWAARFVSF